MSSMIADTVLLILSIINIIQTERSKRWTLPSLFSSQAINKIPKKKEILIPLIILIWLRTRHCHPVSHWNPQSTMNGFSSALCEVNKWDRGMTGLMAKGALLVSIYIYCICKDCMFHLHLCLRFLLDGLRERQTLCVCVCARARMCVCVCVLCVERPKTKQKHEGFLLFSLKLSYFTIMAMCMTLKGIWVFWLWVTIIKA